MHSRFMGEEVWTNNATGETASVHRIVSKLGDGDSGFHKIWLHRILEVVEEVGNAKMQVLMWLLQNADTRNQVLATKQEIAAATGVSRATVTRLMIALREANVIAETRRSLWRLNPDVIFRGTRDKRLAVLHIYEGESGQGDLFERPADAGNVTPINQPRRAA